MERGVWREREDEGRMWMKRESVLYRYERQTDRQIDRQTDRQTDRQRQRESFI